MPNETPFKRRRRIALTRGITTLSSDFAYICKKKPDRIGIIAEGDSWFAYPKKWISLGKEVNIVHHLEEKVSATNTVNLLKLASNGDEAIDMTSGKQFQKLYKILKKNKESIGILMFSGGGNDIVGKNDMLPLLNKYQEGFGYLDCINQTRFEEKLDSIILSYRRLVALCEDIVPNAKIVTHTYDIAKPWDKGAEFIWGLIKTKPWVYPYMVRRKIPRKMHLPVMEYILKQFAARLIALSEEQLINERLIVVDTQGTLSPGSTKDWLNEIHPTSPGFEKIYKKIYREMRNISPNLP